MPRFFFNTNDDVELWDEEGTELPDLDAARRAAIRYAGELLREAGASVGFDETWQLVASDTSEAVVFTIDVKVTLNQAALPVTRLDAAHRQQRPRTRQSERTVHSN
ncbi:DUF6894 family protein [Methylorubrum podarium]|jgi:hypothetical protein|uniref:DUF6894 family protein n=1 Tax=Methylorubrum podarium TaxID=200476 RepID=UPI001EE186ED|nr:hypothetical protein [Methylorubrum podarium]MDV2986448.1 hypothetical protein [Methylobacteriaceae bacterium AG10]GJE71126.1 hypothetical protein CHKEEEPN_2670 [Methylorubrum podarium]